MGLGLAARLGYLSSQSRLYRNMPSDEEIEQYSKRGGLSSMVASGMSRKKKQNQSPLGLEEAQRELMKGRIGMRGWY